MSILPVVCHFYLENARRRRERAKEEERRRRGRAEEEERRQSEYDEATPLTFEEKLLLHQTKNPREGKK